MDYSIDDVKVGACLQHVQDKDDCPVIIKALSHDLYEVLCDDGMTKKLLNLQQIAMDYTIVSILPVSKLADL